MKCRTVIFDLDGTLVDSRPGIEASLCAAAGEYGFSIMTGAVGEHIGPPIAEMITRLLPNANPTAVALISSSYRRIYDGVGCLQAKLYPGVMSLLDGLRQLGARCFIITNKPTLPTDLILVRLKIKSYFDAVLTPNDPAQPFASKTAGVASLLRSHSIDSATACIIGDATDDARAASANHLQFIAASYGYGDAHLQSIYPVAHVLLQPSDLESFLATPTQTVF